MKRNIFLFGVIFFMLMPVYASAPQAYAQAPMVLKFPYEGAPTYPRGQLIELFKQLINERAKGEIKIETYPNASLLPPPEEVSAVTLGTAHIIAPVIGYFEAVEPSIRLFSLPMIFPSLESQKQVCDGPIGQDIMKRLEKKKMKGITCWYESGIQIFSAKKPLIEPEDFKGIKLRTWPSPAMVSSIKALGASPTVLPGVEIYLALQQGVTDASMTTVTYGKSIRIHEVTKYLTIADVSAGMYLFAVNLDTWNKLSPRMQTLISDTAYEVSIENVKRVKREFDEGVKFMKEKGLVVNELSAAQRGKLFEMLKAVHKENASVIGQELIDRVYNMYWVAK